MQLVSFRSDGWMAGLLVGPAVIPADLAAEMAGVEAILPGASVRDILAAGRSVQSALDEAGRRLAAEGRGYPLAEVDLGPPVPDPDKIVCVGLNYRAHAREAGLDLPAAPPLFAKFRNSLIGPTQPITLPRARHEIDYEGELAVVIGSTAKNVSPDQAMDCVAGVMAFNDVSARDLQMQTTQWTAGKAIDSFAPCGPALVLKDEIADIQALDIRTRVNGRVVQQGNTADMIFSVAETISFLSGLMTLEPGDVIATGTPAGVGFSRKPPLLLNDGDVVEVEVEGVGVIRNPVVAARIDASTPALTRTEES